MKFFRGMSKIELINWKKGAILGFYIYMLLLFINYIYSLIYGTEPITSVVIFWTGFFCPCVRNKHESLNIHVCLNKLEYF